MLTGESVPIFKNLIPVADAAALGDRKYMVYSATTVSAGQGMGLVVATEIMRRLERLARWLTR